MSVTIALLCASVAIMAASAARIPLSPDRELSIAIVDPRAGAEHDRLHRTLSNSLSTALAQTNGADIRVHVATVSARDAKLRLGEGGFDAAFVIGADRPLALRRLNMVTLAGTLPTSAGGQSLSLIVADGDRALKELLATAFPRLLADECWQKPLTAQTTTFAGRGAKLATVTR